ncbi:Crp/Fnr family transcriptional regulator [Hydrogenophaga sp. OTU3427]|uniref:Crp/Fnr family transcriptional regulator n=1 Tax=Hydrogenophaga sp. OTU3427 TaxID=3043856 RepID=UPI00313DE92C
MNPVLTERFLAQSSWLSCLTDAQAAGVRQALTFRSFVAGETVCARATPSAHWLGVVDGMLKLENLSEGGKGSTFASVPSGAWFGEGSVLKGEMRPYEVVALRDSVVAFLPRAAFLRMLEESHPFALWLIAQLNARLGHYVALVQNFRLGDTTAQVAYSLSELFNPALYPNTERRITISQEELGRLSGVSRQVANRALQELQEQGVIRLSYGSIEIVDLSALQAIARDS